MKKKKSSLKHTGAFWAFCAPCCIFVCLFPCAACAQHRFFLHQTVGKPLTLWV